MNAAPHPDQVMDIWRSMQEAGLAAPSAAQIGQHVAKVYGELPHPKLPELKLKDYPAVQRVAGMLFADHLPHGQEPSSDQVRHAHETLKAVQMGPAEFESAWSVARPVARRLLGRDPAITDLAHLKGAQPAQIHEFYASHPYPGYEEVTGGQVARYWRSAEAIARQFGRDPNLHEVTRFAAAGYTADDMARHYGGG